MFDERMIGVPNVTQKPNVEIELPKGWAKFEPLDERQVDVNHPVLVFVATLSEFEARERNNRFRERTQQIMQEEIQENGEDSYTLHLQRSALAGADAVDQLLDQIKQDGYFASWVIIERCTID